LTADQKDEKEGQIEVLKFARLALGTINTDKYPSTETTLKVASRIANKLSGGGPIAMPSLAGSTDYAIDSSTKEDLKALWKTYATDKKAGKFSGFFNFTDVQEDITLEEDATKKATLRREVQGLFTGLNKEDFDRLKKLNNTANAIMKDGKKKDGTDVKGIKALMNGQARI